MCQACVKRASEQRDFLPSYQRDGQGREEEDFGGERSGYRGGRRPRSSRVVEGMAGRLKPGRPLLTADGSISRKGRDCRVVIALEGHCASCARALQRGNPALDFEGLAERMARAYRGHHSLAGRLPAIEGQGAASHGLP
ncbi:hypothetical protein GQR58_003572 [Nymphon striatum]|nr:hypothetical protein GQR58_003572 [Nymphon striatum]